MEEAEIGISDKEEKKEKDKIKRPVHVHCKKERKMQDKQRDRYVEKATKEQSHHEGQDSQLSDSHTVVREKCVGEATNEQSQHEERDGQLSNSHRAITPKEAPASSGTSAVCTMPSSGYLAKRCSSPLRVWLPMWWDVFPAVTARCSPCELSGGCASLSSLDRLSLFPSLYTHVLLGVSLLNPMPFSLHQLSHSYGNVSAEPGPSRALYTSSLRRAKAVMSAHNSPLFPYPTVVVFANIHSLLFS